MSSITIGRCPRCSAPQVVPRFSVPPKVPSCLTCTAYEDFLEPEGTFEAPANDGDPHKRARQVLELSAQVGSFQMAELNGEPAAARAFLMNVLRIAEDLAK